MAITRIKNNQITDLTVNAASKLQDFSITSGKIANNLTYGSDLTVAGNLTISGTTTTVETTNLSVEDALLLFASGQTGSPTVDVGFLGERGDETNVAFVWDESAEKFVAAFTTSTDTDTTITVDTYADLEVADLSAVDGAFSGNVDITGDMSLGGNVDSLDVTGNIAGGNLITTGTTETDSLTATTTIDAGGNITGGNLTTSGTTDTDTLTAANSITAGTTVTATGNIDGGNLITSGTTDTDTLTAANSITAGTTVTATGNIDGGNLTTSGTTQTGSLSANTTVTATGNVSGGNIVTGGVVDATGNVSGGNLTTSGTTQTDSLSANTTITATGNIDGGNLTTDGNVDAVGNITGGNIVSLGAFEAETLVSNTSISAGTTITATGNIDGGNLTTSGTTQTGSLSANTTVTATGNVSGGNITTGGVVDATGNVSGGNLVTSGTTDTDTLTAANSITAGTTVTATGNIDGGNLTTGGVVDATGNVSGGNLTTSGTTQTGSLSANTTVTATGNVSGGNLTTGGVVDATGNISGDSLNADTSVVAPNVQVTSATVNEVFFTDSNSELRTDANLTFDTTNLELNGQLTVDNIIVDDNTISSPANVDVVVDNSGTGIFYVDRDTTVSGNLSVLGTTTTVNSTETAIEDPILQLGRGANNDPLTASDGKDRGIAMYYYSGEEKVAFMGYDDPSDEWRFFVDATITDEEVTGTLGGINVGGITTTSIDSEGNISGGNLITTGQVDATGNVSGGNLTTAGTTQTGSLSANTTVTATGNVSGGNITTGGEVDATGNVSGGNLVTSGTTDTNTLTATNSISSGTTITATGNVSGGNLTTAGVVDATGNVIAGNLTTSGTTQTDSLSANTTITATGNVSGGNLTTDGAVDATGNVSGGNLTTSGTTDTDTLTAANSITAGTTVTATGNIDGGNLTTSGTTQTGSLSANTTITATGNVSGGNITTGGVVEATGNVTGGNLTTSGTTQTNSLSANTTITATGNIDGGNLTTSGTTQTNSLSANTTITATGNVSGGNITTGGVVDATGNVTGGNLVTSGELDAETVVANTSVTTPTLTSTADLDITSGANSNINLNPDGDGEVVLSDQVGDRMLFTTANSEISTTANAIFDGENLDITGSLGVDNVRIDDEEIRSLGTELIINRTNGDVDFFVSGNTNPDLFVVDAGTNSIGIGSANVVNGAILTIDSSESIVLPSGTTAERPATPAEGMFRYNETEADLEFYDGTQWTSAATSFTLIESETFSGDGSTTTYTLNEESSTASAIVTINGVVQLPTTAYAISGTTLTFTEAPESGDEIEVRRLTTTTSVTKITNAQTTAVFTAVDGEEQFDVTGNLVPTANVTYDLGSDTERWNDLYLAGNSIVLGNIVIKDGGSNTVAFFGSDGTTPATLDSNNVDTTTISDGNSSISVVTTDGNVEAEVNGSTIATVSSSGLTVTGSIEATNGFVGLDATTIEDGTSSVSVTSTDGNIEADVNGSTIATINSSGLTVTGSIEATNGFVGLDATTIEDGTSSVSVTSPDGSIVANVGGSTVATFTSDGIILDTAPTSANQAVRKSYVDEVAQGLLIRPGVNALSDSNLSATYDNGTDGVGATLTATSNGAFPTVDGITLDTEFDRILVTAQTNAAHNGLYVLTTVGDGSTPWELTRCNTCDESSEIPGSFVFVQDGNTYNATGWIADVDDPSTFTIGTDDIDWLQFSGAGTFTAGDGLELSGSEFSIDSSASVEFAGITVPSITKSGTDGSGNIGSSSNGFDTVFAKATSAQYADLAEMYVADANYEPGIVVAFGGTEEVTISDAESDSRIAGIISTNPSYLMNSNIEGDFTVAVALTGRVPAKVVGTVRKGDMMVSNGDGTARAESNPSIGTVIGKALEDFDGTEGIIEVVVGRL